MSCLKLRASVWSLQLLLAAAAAAVAAEFPPTENTPKENRGYFGCQRRVFEGNPKRKSLVSGNP